MAIAVDAATVARVTMTKIAGDSNPIAATTAAFTAPANSLLVVCVATDSSPGNTPTLTMSNNGAALTWSTRVERGDAEGNDGYAVIARALVASERVGLTVTASAAGHGVASEGSRGSFKVYIVTGHHLTTPDGAVGENSSTTNNITPNAYTSTADASRGFGCASEWNALGAPASSDTEDAFDIASTLSGLSLFKAADTPTSGTVVTMNFDAAGAGAAVWNWVAYEVVPAAGGGGPTQAPRSIAQFRMRRR